MKSTTHAASAVLGAQRMLNELKLNTAVQLAAQKGEHEPHTPLPQDLPSLPSHDPAPEVTTLLTMNTDALPLFGLSINAILSGITQCVPLCPHYACDFVQGYCFLSALCV